jgi:hypothetical protein
LRAFNRQEMPIAAFSKQGSDQGTNYLTFELASSEDKRNLLISSRSRGRTGPRLLLHDAYVKFLGVSPVAGETFGASSPAG